MDCARERGRIREMEREVKSERARAREREGGVVDAANGSDISSCSQTLRVYAKKAEGCARFQCPIRGSI